MKKINMSAFKELYGNVELKDVIQWLVKRANENGKKSNLQNLDFEGINLSNVNFFNSDLSGSTMIKCDLSNAILDGVLFEKGSIFMCKAENLSFKNSFLEGADFSFSELKRADFTGSKGKNVYFYNAKIENVKFGDSLKIFK